MVQYPWNVESSQLVVCVLLKQTHCWVRNNGRPGQPLPSITISISKELSLIQKRFLCRITLAQAILSARMVMHRQCLFGLTISLTFYGLSFFLLVKMHMRTWRTCIFYIKVSYYIFLCFYLWKFYFWENIVLCFINCF